MIVLETARLTLRHLGPGDLDALAAIQAEHGFSLWAAVDRADGRLVGRCGLLPQSLGGAREVEIAYLVGRADWGRGLATEAARAIRDHGLGTLGLGRLVSIIHRDNLASRRVAEKAGLRPERMVQFMEFRCWLYAIESAPDPDGGPDEHPGG